MTPARRVGPAPAFRGASDPESNAILYVAKNEALAKAWKSRVIIKARAEPSPRMDDNNAMWARQPGLK